MQGHAAMQPSYLTWSSRSLARPMAKKSFDEPHVLLVLRGRFRRHDVQRGNHRKAPSARHHGQRRSSERAAKMLLAKGQLLAADSASPAPQWAVSTTIPRFALSPWQCKLAGGVGDMLYGITVLASMILCGRAMP